MITQEKIQEIVQKIVEGYQPERIILFGSYASGSPTEDSDLDLLIVKDVEEPKLERGRKVRKLLRGSLVPIDILIYTPAELNKWKDLPVAFEHHVLQTGKLLYEAA
jgi:predicted nucleotidyltransferase